MRITSLLIFFFCFFTTVAYAKPDIDAQKKAQIQQILNHWRAQSGIPSASLSILLPNAAHPVTFTSGKMGYALFQAGSITKSFTSTIILELEAEGKLNINDPITNYLPQYSRWNQVTIRQLLNHTSGIFNYTETAAFNQIRKNTPQKNFTPQEIVGLVSEHRNYFSPGQGWKYSNTNYVLAGMIIEKVTGKPAETVMNLYLHNKSKWNLSNTFYLARAYTMAFISRMAHGYSSENRDVTTDNMSWASTAGAIVSTPDDLLTWWRGLFQNRILPPHEIAQMTTLVCEKTSSSCRAGQSMPHLNDYQIGKGYGLGVIQSSFGNSKIGTVWWHNGSTKGYKAIVMWYPKSNVYMALTINRDPGYLLKPNSPVVQRILSVLNS